MEDIRKYIRVIHRTAQTYTAKALKSTGLGPTEMQALHHIAWHREMSQRSLTEHLGIDKAAVARLITSLEEKGYLTRSTDPRDKRVNLLTATAAAIAIKKELVAAETDFYQRLFVDLPPDKMAILKEMLSHAFELAISERREGFPFLQSKGDASSCT